MDKFIKYAPVSTFPDKKGYAIQFGASLRRDKGIKGTVEMAVQTKPKPSAGSSESPFDWKDSKLFMQLNAMEIGQILALFRGRLKEVKIIHKSPIDGAEDIQTVSNLTLTESPTGDIGVSMQQKKPGSKEFVRYNIYLKPEDVEILFILFTEILKYMYNTDQMYVPSDATL